MGPRSSQGRMWWGDAAVRGARCSRDAAAGPVAYQGGVGLWWRGAPAEPDGWRLPVDGVGGIPRRGEFGGQVVCTSVRDAVAQTGQRTPRVPVVSWSSQGSGDAVAQPGRPSRSGPGRGGHFGQGVDGAVTGGAVIIGAGFVRVGVQGCGQRAAPVAGQNPVVPPAVPGWPTARRGVWCGRPRVSFCRGLVGAVVLDQYVEEPAEVFGAVVTRAKATTVSSQVVGITDGAVRGADRGHGRW